MQRGAMRIGMAALLALIGLALGAPCVAQACGGMFSPDGSIEQSAQRMIYVQNDDGTLTNVIQIKYEGKAEDFAWVMPLPSVVTAEDLEIVEGGDEMFNELERETEPYYLKPDVCYPRELWLEGGLVGGSAPEGAPGGAQSLASGVVGPFNFDVVQSDDPQALGDWLRENEYQFTPEMETIVQPYIDDGMVFLAMRLRPGEDAGSIEPIQVTYKSDQPMIALRMAAVAARPDTRVRAWFFAKSQAAPLNFARLEIGDEEIRYRLSDTFSRPRGNYDLLRNQKLAEVNGQGFFVDFAGPTAGFEFDNERLARWASEQPFLTRLSSQIPPERMTADPVFGYDSSLPDRPQAHNLNAVQPVIEDCQRQQNEETLKLAALIGAPCVAGLGALAGAAILVKALIRRRSRKPAAASG